MDKNKYSSDMKEEIKEICTELNDGKIAVVQATEKLLDLFSVSKSVNCEHTGDEILHQGNGFIYKTCADCGEDI